MFAHPPPLLFCSGLEMGECVFLEFLTLFQNGNSTYIFTLSANC